jgi:hypothetical protein
MSSFSHCWYEIVESYTKVQLTFSKDKLVAIAGLVQHIQSATKDEYLASLWKSHLATDLLWFTAEGPGRRPLEKPPKKQAKDSTSKLARSFGKHTGGEIRRWASQSKWKKSVLSLPKLLQTCRQKDKKFLRHSTLEKLALCPRKLRQIHPQKDKKCLHRSTRKELALHSQKLPQTYQQKNEEAGLSRIPQKHPVLGEKLIRRLRGRERQLKAWLPSTCYPKCNEVRGEKLVSDLSAVANQMAREKRSLA